jgi:hypothetical protein
MSTLDLVIESLLAVSHLLLKVCYKSDETNKSQANPKLANLRDDDDRLPIHWAVSYGHLNIAVLLSGVKNFDPDVQVRLSFECFQIIFQILSYFLKHEVHILQER